nr:alpha-L-arabinofuranosidase C-terminal domain-containing protein [Candidatus Aquiluna sp. UB-MaderosW2red]
MNRSQTETLSVSIGLRDLEGLARLSAESLFDSDVNAANTLADPERVGMQQNSSAKIVAGVLHIELQPVSWTAIAFG